MNGTDAVREGIVQFAMQKLLNGEHRSFDLQQQLAPLAVRLPLSFNVQTEQGREGESCQIESHMRICLNIEADAMYSVAPSEPMLNEAAAQIMEDREKERPGSSIDTLHKFLSDRYLSKGDRGELACMLLLLLAHDRTCKAQQKKGTPDEDIMPYHKAIPVTDFLTNLFAEDHKAGILGSQSELDGPTLEETFGNSWMHFTHFIEVHDFEIVK